MSSTGIAVIPRRPERVAAARRLIIARTTTADVARANLARVSAVLGMRRGRTRRAAAGGPSARAPRTVELPSGAPVATSDRLGRLGGLRLDAGGAARSPEGRGALVNVGRRTARTRPGPPWPRRPRLQRLSPNRGNQASGRTRRPPPKRSAPCAPQQAVPVAPPSSFDELPQLGFAVFGRSKRLLHAMVSRRRVARRSSSRMRFSATRRR